MTEFWRTSKRCGSSLLEAILAIAVFGIMAAASMYLVAGPLSSANTAMDRQRALFLAEEGIEAARAIQDDRWTALTVGDHGLTDISGRWQFSGSQDVSADGFTRAVTVEAVERDSGGDIVLSGGTVDRRTRRVISTVSWERFGISRQVSTVAYLTDWDTYDWRHTTDSDFLPGEMNYTRVVGSGADASVQLAPAAEKMWEPSEGSLIIHTTDEDWSPGTFTDTELAGTGIPASINETGPRRWISIRSGQSLFHTTDLDFASGTFSDTAVVDTGDLGAVSLDTGDGWAVYVPPPVNDHLNAVDFASSVDGWAVGDGGRIVRWDGVDWYAFDSPTAKQLNDVDALTASEAYAVGANGAAIRWNGTAWSNLSAPQGTYYSVSMLSSTDGWAVGASGKIWRWDGVAWSQFVDTGNETWLAVDMVSASDGWVASSGGDIRRWNGTAWNPVTSPTTKPLDGLDCANASLCFAVGGQGEIIRWNGTAWSIFASPTANNLFDVSLSSVTNGWAVGAGGTFIKWNGTAWSSVSAPTGLQMNGVFSLSASEVYAVGNNGEIVQYGRNYLAYGIFVSPVFDAGQSVDWGHAYWDERLPETTDLTIAFRSGDTPTPDGSWSSWSGEFSNPFDTTIPSPSSRYLQYRVTLSTENLFVAPRLNSIAIYYDEPPTASFYDIKVLEGGTEGWSVGQSGSIARLSGGEWSAYTPSPTTETLFALDYSAADNVYAVGYNGTIIKWNGTAWSLVTSPTTNHLYGFDMLPDGSGWAVGRQGEIVELRTNGQWRLYDTSPTARDLNDVSLSSATNGWAVGNSGTAIHWDGVSWTEVPIGTTKAINGVYTVSETFAVAVGQSGEVFHWDGAVWNLIPSTTPNALNDVSCTAVDNCWAVGVEQTFISWDGAAWSQYFFENPSNPIVQSISLVVSGESWSTGEGSALYSFSIYSQPQAYYHSPVVDSGESASVWDTISWDSIEPLFTGMSMAVRTGETATPDASWSDWTAEMSDKGGSTIFAPAGRYLQYRVSFYTSDNAATAILEETRLIHGAVTAQDLYDTDGTSVSDVWAVGRAGTIVHYDGIEWSLDSSPVVRSLHGVAAISPTDAWAVGHQGAIIHWDGLDWTEYTPSPTAEDLRSISAVSASDIWAVGHQGTIIHYDGVSWSSVSSPTAVDLYGVDLSTASVGFAVGESGAILEWDGVSWTSYSSPVSANLNAVFLLPTSIGWAVGDSGTVIKWNGVAWTVDSQPLMVRLNAVEGRSANEAWIAGDFGAILEWDGVSWSSFTSPTSRHLYGITVYAPTDGWICGRLGILLKDPDEYPSVGTYTSTVLDADSAAQALTAYWWETNPVGTDVTVAVRSGDTPAPDGSWSAWSSELSDETGAFVSLPSGRYFQYRLTLTTSDPLLTPSLDEILVTYTLE